MTTLEFLNVLLLVVTAAVGVYAWRKSKELEAYKAELSKELEAYKAELSKELEAYKSDLNKDVEAYKSRLGTKTYITQKKYDMELGIYDCIWEKIVDLEGYAKSVKVVDNDFSPDYSNKFDELTNLLDKKRPFMDNEISKKVEQLMNLNTMIELKKRAENEIKQGKREEIPEHYLNILEGGIQNIEYKKYEVSNAISKRLDNIEVK